MNARHSILWMAVLVATTIWLGGRKALIVLAFPPVAMELYHGNVHLLIAAAIVLGFRHPWTWSFVLLTKPTAGVGLLWFATRREWRQLGIAFGATAVIVGISFLIAPTMWSDWVGYLVTNASVAPGGAWVPVPLWVRVPVAAALVIWGARTDRRDELTAFHGVSPVEIFECGPGPANRPARPAATMMPLPNRYKATAFTNRRGSVNAKIGQAAPIAAPLSPIGGFRPGPSSQA